MRPYSIDFTDSPSLTVQSAAGECDIHHILARYRKTGVLPQVSGAFYSDVTSAVDYQTACDTVIRCTDAFNALPAAERAKFYNDVRTWLEVAGAGGAQPPDSSANAERSLKAPQDAANAAAPLSQNTEG